MPDQSIFRVAVTVTELCVATDIVGDKCVLTLIGEIDMNCSEKIGDLGVGTLESHTIRRLTVDMSAVTFIDSTGLGALVRFNKAATEQGKSWSIRDPSEAVLKLLKLVALDKALPIESSGDVMRGSRWSTLRPWHKTTVTPTGGRHRT